ncbi:SPOR domain-containing protein [Bacteroides sp. 51]|uniref:SPOR domain-containing protein n=1 Tax=Bacteroides sp. 51 TaxID=2302938 RepID=UPI0013D89205|nr:SPOR domain-containing protein [Bacteroides sp. 51]NDV81676.1 SPOR domain-containing protein [Bacteroides sp. 51]
MKTYTSYFCLLLLFLCLAGNVQAQDNIVKSLESNAPGEGRVTIHQDPKIGVLIGSPHGLSSSGDGIIKMAGYRVQVYSGGNSRNSKREAESMAARVRSGFPELKIYTMFNPPRWLCRVGDFLSMEEADAMMRKLRKEGGFKEAAIIKDQVNISL